VFVTHITEYRTARMLLTMGDVHTSFMQVHSLETLLVLRRRQTDTHKLQSAVGNGNKMFKKKGTGGNSFLQAENKRYPSNQSSYSSHAGFLFVLIDQQPIRNSVIESLSTSN
jgi:hypothetical protein